jgi:hypothetical protein
MLNVAILITPERFDGPFYSYWSKPIGTRCLRIYSPGQVRARSEILYGLRDFLLDLVKLDVSRVLVWHIGDTLLDQEVFETVAEFVVVLQAQGVDCDHQLIPKQAASDRVHKELRRFRPFKAKSTGELERSKPGGCVRTWEAAAYLGVSERTVVEWCRAGTVKAAGGRCDPTFPTHNSPGIGRGENWRIPEREIGRLLRERE